MSYLVYRNKNNQNVSLSGTKYTGLDSYGTYHLCLRTGAGTNDVVRYGLTTNTSATGMKISYGNKEIGIANKYTTTSSYRITVTKTYSTSTSSQTISSVSQSYPGMSGVSTKRIIGSTATFYGSTSDWYGYINGSQSTSWFVTVLYGSTLANTTHPTTGNGAVASTAYDSYFSTSCSNTTIWTSSGEHAIYGDGNDIVNRFARITNSLKSLIKNSSGSSSLNFKHTYSSGVTHVGPFGGQYGTMRLSYLAPFRYFEGVQVTRMSTRSDYEYEEDGDENHLYTCSHSGNCITAFTLYNNYYFMTRTGTHSSSRTVTSTMRSTTRLNSSQQSSSQSNYTSHNVNF